MTSLLYLAVALVTLSVVALGLTVTGLLRRMRRVELHLGLKEK